MKVIPWQRKPVFFFCPACNRWVNDAVVTHDQCHDRTRGGCGEFVFTRADVAGMAQVGDVADQRQAGG